STTYLLTIRSKTKTRHFPYTTLFRSRSAPASCRRPSTATTPRTPASTTSRTGRGPTPSVPCSATRSGSAVTTPCSWSASGPGRRRRRHVPRSPRAVRPGSRRRNDDHHQAPARGVLPGRPGLLRHLRPPHRGRLLRLPPEHAPRPRRLGAPRDGRVDRAHAARPHAATPGLEDPHLRTARQRPAHRGRRLGVLRPPRAAVQVPAR